MARALTLGNGTFVVCLDEYGFVRDLYFPYVGLENQVLGEKHRIGFWRDNTFSWIDDGTWEITIGYKPGTMVGYLVCKNSALAVTLVMEDVVYNETTVFLRQVDVYNHSEQKRDFRLFFHQVFAISESKKRNTAFFDPTHNAIVHYKGRRVFIVNGRTAAGTAIDDYSVGAYAFAGKEGTYKDAEDGVLSKNAVEHGSVDSVIRFSLSCEPNEKARLYYWICAEKTLNAAYDLNELVLRKTPAAMIHSTESYWHAWLKTRRHDLAGLSKEQERLFDTSLFILRCHMDNRGSIIASADSAMMEYGKDDYTYMWPRDAAFIVMTMCRAGYAETTKPFFKFCQSVLHEDGYLHHRYRSDESLGSTWHAATSQREWLKDKILQLPIQEDESASVLVALWKYYESSKDLEFIEDLYKPLIEKIATFLVRFRSAETALPLPSYDLWEEKIGVSTYTCAAVYGGLIAAAKFSELLDKRNHMREYRKAADEIKKATMQHLYSENRSAFIRLATIIDGQIVQDETIDSSSLFGLWYFGMLDLRDPLLQKTAEQVQKHLVNPAQAGGYIRYERDNYFKAKDLANPWFITTLWELQRIILHPDTRIENLDSLLSGLDWVIAHRYNSGILAEQLDPYDGSSQSATPLVWSHAVYIETVLTYLERRLELQSPADPNLIHEL
ncbi:MAG: hypothetical protein A2632_01205 [Candidatus Pacebacteria bacterium RIFCSPHIGHO2_01_FULL_46_16]|nr:MAG: hypothetical protein A2632_01205 [Candidatus Pacebacteria bacterium RIFCSPHIGHO2_01_FULL_46_16]